MDDITKPLGFDAAAADWSVPFAGREMQINDWNALTLGEQARYARQDCKTKGAIYKSTINSKSISFTVTLPDNLSMGGLTRDDAERLERYLHRKMEEQIVAILQMRTHLRSKNDG